MSWNFKLVTEPQKEFDSSTPGLVNHRRIFGPKAGSYIEVPLHLSGDESCRFTPRYGSQRPRSIVVPVIDGPDQVFMNKRELMDLVVTVDTWSNDEMQELERIMASGRLVAFSPDWDRWTIWQSSFGGMDPGGGLAEIGASDAGQWGGRSDDDAWPGRTDGENILAYAGDANIPKLTRGHIGNAIIIDGGDRPNLVATNQAWSGGGGEVDAVGQSNVDASPFTAYLIRIDTAGNAASYPASASQSASTYVASVWVRGEGTWRIELARAGGSTFNGADTVLSPDTWTRLWVSGTTSGSGALTVSLRSRVANHGWVIAGPPMIEEGAYPSSLCGSTGAMPFPDTLYVNDGFPGGSMTFHFWYKYEAASPTDQLFFAGWLEGGVFMYIKIVNGQYRVLVGNTPEVQENGARAVGSWALLTVVFDRGSTDMRTRIFENGVELGSTTAGTLHNMNAGGGWYVGSDRGNTGTRGLHYPLDAVRVDARPWTDAEILDYYTMRTTDGIREILAKTQGRFFQITGLPGKYRKPLTVQEGEITLQEVSHSPTGLIS